MTKTPDYARKIAALLAKANDPAATPAEAEAFSAKAEELMVKWGISDAELDATRRGQKKAGEKIIETRIVLDGSDARSLIRIGFAIGRGLGNVRTLKSTGRGTMGQVLYLIGFESDVKRAKMLYDSLAAQALVARGLWWVDCDDKKVMTTNQKFLAKRQFIWSFASAVEDRLTAARTTAEEQVSTGTELVLVDRKSKVDDWLGVQYPSLRTARGQRGSMAGRGAGHAAGQRASLNESRIASQKQVNR